MQTVWRKFLDTNVLIYAESFDNPIKHDISLTLIDQLMNEENGFLSNQILAEFSNQMSSAMTSSEINERILDYQTSFNIIHYSIEDIKTANISFETYKIHFFDALIVATMKSNNIDTIITENEKDFKKIPWLKVINPFK